MERARAHLQAQAGIRDVQTNLTAGSITVHYDPGARTSSDVLAMLADVGLIVREVLAVAEDGPPGAGHSLASASLIGALTNLDSRISRLTGRKVDLKLLFPTALGLLGLRQVLAEGLGLTQVPGYILLWYAFDAFYKLHAAPTLEPTESGAVPAAPEGA